MVQRKSWSWVTDKERLTDFSYSDWCVDLMCFMKYLKKWCLWIVYLISCPGLEGLLYSPMQVYVYVDFCCFGKSILAPGWLNLFSVLVKILVLKKEKIVGWLLIWGVLMLRRFLALLFWVRVICLSCHWGEG